MEDSQIDTPIGEYKIPGEDESFGLTSAYSKPTSSGFICRRVFGLNARFMRKSHGFLRPSLR